jgi:hypothetical protein
MLTSRIFYVFSPRLSNNLAAMTKTSPALGIARCEGHARNRVGGAKQLNTCPLRRSVGAESLEMPRKISGLLATTLTALRGEKVVEDGGRLQNPGNRVPNKKTRKAKPTIATTQKDLSEKPCEKAAARVRLLPMVMMLTPFLTGSTYRSH